MIFIPTKLLTIVLPVKKNIPPDAANTLVRILFLLSYRMFHPWRRKLCQGAVWHGTHSLTLPPRTGFQRVVNWWCVCLFASTCYPSNQAARAERWQGREGRDDRLEYVLVARFLLTHPQQNLPSLSGAASRVSNEPRCLNG